MCNVENMLRLYHEFIDLFVVVCVLCRTSEMESVSSGLSRPLRCVSSPSLIVVTSTDASLCLRSSCDMPRLHPSDHPSHAPKLSKTVNKIISRRSLSELRKRRKQSGHATLPLFFRPFADPICRFPSVRRLWRSSRVPCTLGASCKVPGWIDLWAKKSAEHTA